MKDIDDYLDEHKRVGKTFKFILIGAITFLVVMYCLRTPDGANPAYITHMETKYFTVITHSPRFKLVYESEKLVRDGIIYSGYVDSFAEKVFNWILKDAFTDKLRVRINEKSLYHSTPGNRYEIAFWSDKNEMYIAYVEYSNRFNDAYENYLFWPQKGFANAFSPAVLFYVIVQSNIYKICQDNDIKFPYHFDTEYLKKLKKRFDNWNYGEAKTGIDINLEYKDLPGVKK